ncbi:hypothetical protein IP93_01722 [Lysobacter ruishenii]|uniref:Uncharacterized protein n=1 Tax=Aerolutibacter ruishenii TaxID=686800 RepID=A0A562LSQ2_9GAMM|nr:hypothetical protein IP93_01722 [Lysobacter ruishenii]
MQRGVGLGVCHLATIPPRIVGPHRATHPLLLLELGVVQVQHAVPGVVGFELQHRHDAITRGIAGLHPALGTLQRDRVVRLGALRRAPQRGIGPPPGLVVLFLERRVESRNADRHAEGVVGELVDVRRGRAVARFVAAVGQVAQRVVLALATEDDALLAKIKRPDRLHVHRAGQTLAHQRRIRRLVHGHAVDQFRRVLVELDATAVAGAGLFAPVEQRPRELLGHAADMDDLATSFLALHGQARQARNRVGDADVGQLAQVLGRDCFDDRSRLDLGLDGRDDGRTDARDLDGLDRGIGLLGLGCRLLLGRLRFLGVQLRAGDQGKAARGGQHMTLRTVVLHARGWAARSGFAVHQVPSQGNLTALSYRGLIGLSMNFWSGPDP